MTDQELNEQIARLMGGWKQVEGDGWVHHEKYYYKAPPNFLDPKRLGELVELATRLGTWQWSHESPGGFFASLDPDDCPGHGEGSTPSLALARAIVEYKEGQSERASYTPEDARTTTAKTRESSLEA